MKLQLYYTIEVRDRDGKLLKRLKRRARSFVRQWNQIVCVQANGVSLAGITDITNTVRTVQDYASNLKMATVETNDDVGVVIGTGDTAVTINDYALETLIAHGTGSGQMHYYACVVADAAVVGSDCSFTVTRVIGNQSGAAITVKEIGIYIIGYVAITTSFLGVRDVLASSVAVPDGGAITVVYTIKVSV